MACKDIKWFPTTRKKAAFALREEQFIQHFLEFYFDKVCYLSLPEEFPRLLVSFYDEDSPLTDNIAKTLLLLTFDFRYEESLCYNILSDEFKEKIKERDKFTPQEFLRFIANYTLKATCDGLENKVSSPIECYNSIVRVLKNTREFNGADWLMHQFNKCEIQEIKVDDRVALFVNSLNLKCKPVRILEERMFILDTMKYICSLNNKILPLYLRALRIKLDVEYLKENGKSLIAYRRQVFTEQIQYCISLLHNGDNDLKNDDGAFIQIYLDKLAQRKLSAYSFMVFCVFFTKRALLNYSVKNSLPLFKAYVIMICLFEHAIHQNLFTFQQLRLHSTSGVGASKSRIKVI